MFEDDLGIKEFSTSALSYSINKIYLNRTLYLKFLQGYPSIPL